MGAVGPFIAMTARDDAAKKRSTAYRASVIATIVLLVCTAVGTFMISFFGFSIPALKIAGGVLLFGVGIDMLNARESRSKATAEERQEGALKDDVAIFPLGIPLLSGPGSMVTVFILSEKAKTTFEHIWIYISIILTMTLSYIVLTQSTRLARAFGATGMNVLSRIMGLILAAIAVQFIIDGLLIALPGLGAIKP